MSTYYVGCIFNINRNWNNVSFFLIYFVIFHFNRKLCIYFVIYNFRFGVVIAFVTNSYLQAGIVNATTTAREGVDDTQKFLKSTSQQANHILVKNYDELSTHLDYMLSGTLL